MPRRLLSPLCQVPPLGSFRGGLTERLKSLVRGAHQRTRWNASGALPGSLLLIAAFTRADATSVGVATNSRARLLYRACTRQLLLLGTSTTAWGPLWLLSQ